MSKGVNIKFAKQLLQQVVIDEEDVVLAIDLLARNLSVDNLEICILSLRKRKEINIYIDADPVEDVIERARSRLQKENLSSLVDEVEVEEIDDEVEEEIEDEIEDEVEEEMEEMEEEMEEMEEEIEPVPAPVRSKVKPKTMPKIPAKASFLDLTYTDEIDIVPTVIGDPKPSNVPTQDRRPAASAVQNQKSAAEVSHPKEFGSLSARLETRTSDSNQKEAISSHIAAKTGKRILPKLTTGPSVQDQTTGPLPSKAKMALPKWATQSGRPQSQLSDSGSTTSDQSRTDTKSEVSAKPSQKVNSKLNQKPMDETVPDRKTGSSDPDRKTGSSVLDRKSTTEAAQKSQGLNKEQKIPKAQEKTEYSMHALIENLKEHGREAGYIHENSCDTFYMDDQTVTLSKTTPVTISTSFATVMLRYDDVLGNWMATIDMV